MHSVHAPVSDVNVWEPPPLSTVTVPAVMSSGFGLNEKFVAVIVPPPGAGNVVVVVVVVVVVIGGSVGTGSVGTGSVDGSVGVGSSVATTALVGDSVLATVVVVVGVVVVDGELVALELRLDELDPAAFEFGLPPPHATSVVSRTTAMKARTAARTPVDTDGVSREIAR